MPDAGREKDIRVVAEEVSLSLAFFLRIANHKSKRSELRREQSALTISMAGSPQENASIYLDTRSRLRVSVVNDEKRFLLFLSVTKSRVRFFTSRQKRRDGSRKPRAQ